MKITKVRGLLYKVAKVLWDIQAISQRRS